MGIQTVFAHVSCSNISVSAPWYETLFDRKPIRRPTESVMEWQFSDSAEVRLHEEKAQAGSSTLTLGVLPLEPEQKRLLIAGLKPGQIEQTNGFFIMRLRDPDDNLIVFASAKRA